MDHSTFEVYKGKTFASLCKDIVVNQEQKRDQLDILISELRGFIKSTNDAIVLVPLLREYFDIGVRNDEQLIKLAAIVQRILTKNETGEEGGSSFLTDEEKKQLMKEIDDVKKEDKKFESEIKNGLKLMS